jgi:DNA polymerase-3 subunit beta
MGAFQIEASALKAALAVVRPAVEAKGANPLAAYVQVVVGDDSVAVTANRGDISMRSAFRADPGDTCEVVAPHDRLAQIVGLYDGQTLTMAYKPGTRALTIRAAKASHVLTCADPADWAPLDWAAKGRGTDAPPPSPIILAAAGWSHLWGVAGYASADVNRYGLAGVHLERVGDGETLRAAATDGSRLCWRGARAEATIPISGADLPRKALISREMAGVLGKAAGGAGAEDLFALTVGERVAVWSQVDADGDEVGSLRVRFSLAEGEFPDYRQVIPAGIKRTCTVKVGALATALRSVAVSATDKQSSVRCSFEEGRMLLSAQDVGGKGGEARAEVECDFDGSPLSTGFNATYLDAVLRGATGDSVTVHLGEALDPAIWLGELWRPQTGRLADVADLVVVMPMRLD